MPDEAPKAAPADEKPRRSWFRREPLDEAGQKTMYLGLFIAFALYALSFVVTALYRDRAWASIASLVLILGSVLFLGVWFLAVRGGFRLGKPKSRGKRRAAMHAKEEREKRIRLNR